MIPCRSGSEEPKWAESTGSVGTHGNARMKLVERSAAINATDRLEAGSCIKVKEDCFVHVS